MSTLKKEKIIVGKEIPRDRVFRTPLRASQEISERYKGSLGNIHRVRRLSKGYEVVSISWDEFIDSKLYKKK